MKMTKTIALTLTACLATIAGAVAQDAKLPPASTKQNVTYATDIKAILDVSCAKCHGADKPKARLRLDNLEGTLKGSKDGKILTPGDSANSFIVKSIAHATKETDAWMPPLKNRAGIKPLTPEDVAEVIVWAAGRPAHVNIARVSMTTIHQANSILFHRES